MSDSHAPASAPAPLGDGKVWTQVAVFLGIILLFALILAVAYLPNRPAPVDAERAAYRATKRAEREALVAQQRDSYGWVDKNTGVVRLPIARAMELTVQEHAAPAAKP